MLSLGRVVGEVSGFALATALSYNKRCRNTFAIAKGSIDGLMLVKRAYKGTWLALDERLIKHCCIEELRGTKFYQKVAKKLAKTDVSKSELESYIQTKKRRNREKINLLIRCLVADAVAAIPYIGLHLSWRIDANYKGFSFYLIFEKGIAQISRPFRKPLSRITLFPAFTAGKHDSSPHYPTFHIPVVTPTKKRTIRVEYSSFDEQTIKEKKIHKGPTVVFFHGNGMLGSDFMGNSAVNNFIDKGYNVMLMTIGGYGGCRQVTSSEKSCYQDIEAIRTFLVENGVTSVGYYGLSLGGALAIEAALADESINGKNLKPLFVILNKTFASAELVGENLGRNIFPPLAPIGKALMSIITPKDQWIPLPNGKSVVLNGFNTLEKAAKLGEKKVPLYSVKGTRDNFMGRKRIGEHFEEDFADDIHRAYGKESGKLYSLDVGHNNGLLHPKLWDQIPEVPKT